MLNLHISSFYSSTRCQRTIPRCEGLATPKMGKRRGLLSPIPDDVHNSWDWESSVGPVSRQIGSYLLVATHARPIRGAQGLDIKTSTSTSTSSKGEKC